MGRARVIDCLLGQPLAGWLESHSRERAMGHTSGECWQEEGGLGRSGRPERARYNSEGVGWSPAPTQRSPC
eukprot:1126497-Alexandrium_andersonii.AAC.1